MRNGLVISDGESHTFSGMAAYTPAMFNAIAAGAKAKLATMLREQIKWKRVGGEVFPGRWYDVGTPARLASLERELASAPAERGV